MCVTVTSSLPPPPQEEAVVVEVEVMGMERPDYAASDRTVSLVLVPLSVFWPCYNRMTHDDEDEDREVTIMIMFKDIP